MGPRAKTKKHRAGKKHKPARPVDVRLALSQQLHAAAFSTLAQLVEAETGPKHALLAADVFRIGAAAVSRFVFCPDEPAVFLTKIDKIIDHLGLDNDPANFADATRQAVEEIMQSAELLRQVLSNDKVDSDSDPQVLNRLADQSVHQPGLLDRLSPEIASEVKDVRDALANLESGRDEAALDAVSAIHFRSVMAPWRLLIRGMVHFYAGRYGEAEQRWQRVPQNRLPRGMARVMLATVDQVLGDEQRPDPRSWNELVTRDQQSDETIRQRLRQWFDDEAYDEIAEQLERWSRGASVDSAWISAARDRVYAELLVQSDVRFVKRSSARLPSPSWDPEFALPLAIAKLLSSDPTRENATAAVDKYLDSIDRNESLTDMDRRAIRAAVQFHLAYLHLDLLREISGRVAYEAKAEAERTRIGTRFGQRFTELIRECIELWPHWDAPYELLTGDVDTEFIPFAVLGEIQQIRLRDRGDEVGVLGDAVGYFLAVRDLEQAEPLVRKLRQLAPRDKQTREVVWGYGTKMFRREAMAKHFDEAHAAADLMESHLPAALSPGLIPLMHAAIQLKKDCDADIDDLLADANERGISRLTATFIMDIHAARLKLDASVKKRFREDRKRLSKSPSIADVQGACGTIGPVVSTDRDDYTGRVGHLKELIAVTKRALSKSPRSQWTIQAANDVGTFAVFADDSVLRRQFIRAIRYHPRWHIYDLMQAIERGPEHAMYHLRDVVAAEKDDPCGLPEPLRDAARRLYEQSVEFNRFDRFRDDEESDWDDSQWDDDIEGEFGSPKPEDFAEVIPPEMIEAFRSDPQRFEREMRKSIPKSVADAILPILRKIAKQH